MFPDILIGFFSVFGTLIVFCYTTPIILAMVIPLIVIFIYIQKLYLATSRQLKRMVSVSTSPINSSMTESFNGAATIRAYKMESKFIEDNNSRIELNQRCYYPEIVSDPWVFCKLEILANIFLLFNQSESLNFKLIFQLIIFTALFAVIYRDTMDPGLTGLALTYIFTFALDIYLVAR